MNTIDRLLLLKKMQKEIGRDYGDGVQVLTHEFEIQDDSRLTAVIKIDISLNDRTGVVETINKLINGNKICMAVTDVIIDKLKGYIKDEMYKIREQVKDVLDV